MLPRSEIRAGDRKVQWETRGYGFVQCWPTPRHIISSGLLWYLAVRMFARRWPNMSSILPLFVQDRLFSECVRNFTTGSQQNGGRSSVRILEVRWITCSSWMAKARIHIPNFSSFWLLYVIIKSTQLASHVWCWAVCLKHIIKVPKFSVGLIPDALVPWLTSFMGHLVIMVQVSVSSVDWLQ